MQTTACIAQARTLIYFARELLGLSEELSPAGFQVYEALAVSQVF